MFNSQQFSWVVGQVFGAEFFGDFAILNQGAGAFSVVRVSSREFLACCPDWSSAFRRIRRAMVEAA